MKEQITQRLKGLLVTEPKTILDWINDGKITKAEVLEIFDTDINIKNKYGHVFYVSKEQHLENIKNEKYSIAQIRELVNDDTLDFKVLTRFHLTKLTKNTHSTEEIKIALENGEIEKEDLVPTYYSLDAFYKLVGQKKPPKGIDTNWEPVLLEDNRIDVFLLGVAGSGKSVFLSGLLYFAHQIGKIRLGIDNAAGYKYAQSLIDAVAVELLPPATPKDKMQFMACNLTNANNEKAPFSFVEMSGEIIRQAYQNTKPPQNFVDYISSPNNKVILMAIQYTDVESYEQASQQAQLDYAIQFLERHGTLDNTEALAIVITQWDVSKDMSEAAAIAFIQKRFKNLFNLVKTIAESKNIPFKLFTYSHGIFDESDGYTFEPSYAKKMFEWLTSFASVQAVPKKLSLIRRIFK
jgi:Double-GTPase 1